MCVCVCVCVQLLQSKTERSYACYILMCTYESHCILLFVFNIFWFPPHLQQREYPEYKLASFISGSKQGTINNSNFIPKSVIVTTVFIILEFLADVEQQ